MLHPHRHTGHGREAIGQLTAHDDRAMLSAGAPHCDDRMPLVLALVALEHRPQRRRVRLDELGGPALAEDEVADVIVFARQRAQTSFQNGLGRKRMSATRSASGGRPYLNPKLRTVTVWRAASSSVKRSVTWVASSWML